MKNLYDMSIKLNKGDVLNMEPLSDSVLLLVNTASKCGLTPQYEALEMIHLKYKDKGLCVIGFPCDQFGGQEPGSNEEIADFCKINYGVSFSLTDKIDVNGPKSHEIFTYLKNHARGIFGEAIAWNFTKFLVARNATEIIRYAPTTNPHDIERDIERFLQ